MLKKVCVILLMAGLLSAGVIFAQDFAFKVPASKTELENVIKAGAQSIKGVLGVYMKHVESGEAIGFNEQRRFQLASVFKIPVLVTLYKQIHLGRISLDDRIMFEQKMKTFGSGLMNDMKPGLNISIQDLQLLMMARSDNAATDILYRLVTPETIQAYMKELGLNDMTISYDTRQLILAYLGLDPSKPMTPAELGETVPETFWGSKEQLERQKAFEASEANTSTPRDIGALLEKCVKGEIVDRATSDQVLEIMKRHTGAEIILRYLPFSTEIARKGGSLAKDGEDTVLLDSAVIWLPRDAGHLILCVWGNELQEVHYELKHKMGVIARAGYDYFLAKNKKK
jgi:beta-lactamase class A